MTRVMGWCLDNKHESCRHTVKTTDDRVSVCDCECHK